MSSSIHASAALVGPKAVLIRGPSGAGKSRLLWSLIEAASAGVLPFARLVADDRAVVEAQSGRLLVRPAPALAGLLEIHGLGIRHLPYEALAVVGLVVDLGLPGVDRLPAPGATETSLCGITLPRLGVAAGQEALLLVLATLRIAAGGD